MARILAVDDEAGIRAFVAEVLEGEGHEVVEAEDGPAALGRLEDGPFDLMLVDLRMPGTVGGMDVLRRARAEWPGMQIIVLTAYGTVATAVEAMRLGAFDFAEKPLEGPAALRRQVMRALNWRGARAPAPLPEPAPQPQSAAEAACGWVARARRFLGELRRRHVYNVAATYAAVAYVALEGAQLVMPALPLPAWAYNAVVALTIGGFPLALVLGWVYDVTATSAGRAIVVTR